MPIRKFAAVRGYRMRKVCPRLYTYMEFSGVEERRRVDDGCTRCIAVHERFTSKNICVTADVKQKVRLRFMLNIANTNQLKTCFDRPQYQVSFIPDQHHIRNKWTQTSLEDTKYRKYQYYINQVSCIRGNMTSSVLHLRHRAPVCWEREYNIPLCRVVG